MEGVEASRVVVDDYIMSFLLVEALIRKGRRRIVHLAGPKHVRNAVARLQAYRDALRKFGMEVDWRLSRCGWRLQFPRSWQTEEILRRLVNGAGKGGGRIPWDIPVPWGHPQSIPELKN